MGKIIISEISEIGKNTSESSDKKSNKGKDGLYGVYVGGEYKFAADAGFLFDNGIRAGKEFTETDFEELCLLANIRKIYRRGIYLIQTRDYSEKEMIKKLTFKTDYDENDVLEAVSLLVEKNYINDEKYANRIVEIYLPKYGYGRVKQELYKRGINREMTEEILQNSEEENDEVQKIMNLLLKTMKGLPIDDKKTRDRLFNKFVRQGYGFDDIKKAFRKYNDNEYESDE